MSNVFDDIVHIAKAQSDAYSTAYQAGHAQGYHEGYLAAMAKCKEMINESFDKRSEKPL